MVRQERTGSPLRTSSSAIFFAISMLAAAAPDATSAPPVAASTVSGFEQILFADGFESGNTSAWSATVPACSIPADTIHEVLEVDTTGTCVLIDGALASLGECGTAGYTIESVGPYQPDSGAFFTDSGCTAALTVGSVPAGTQVYYQAEPYVATHNPGSAPQPLDGATFSYSAAETEDVGVARIAIAGCSNNSFPTIAGISHDCVEGSECVVTLLADDDDPLDTLVFTFEGFNPTFGANFRTSADIPLSVGDPIPDDDIVTFDPIALLGPGTFTDVFTFTVSDECSTSLESSNIDFVIQNVDDAPSNTQDIDYTVPQDLSSPHGVAITFVDFDDDLVEVVFDTVLDSSLGHFEDHNGLPIAAGGTYYCGIECPQNGSGIKFMPSDAAPTNAFLGDATYRVCDVNTPALLCSDPKTISVSRAPWTRLKVDEASTQLTFAEGDQAVTTLTVTILQPDLPELVATNLQLGLLGFVGPDDPDLGFYPARWPQVTARDNMPPHDSGVVFPWTPERYDIGSCGTDCTGPLWYPFDLTYVSASNNEIPIIRYDSTICNEQICEFEVDVRACLDSETTDIDTHGGACNKDFAAAAGDLAKISILVATPGEFADGGRACVNDAGTARCSHFFTVDLTVTNDNVDAGPRLLLENNPSVNPSPGAGTSCNGAFDTAKAVATYCASLFAPTAQGLPCVTAPFSGGWCLQSRWPVFAFDLIDDEAQVSLWKLRVVGVDAENEDPLGAALADTSYSTTEFVDGAQHGFEMESSDILELRRALHGGVIVEGDIASGFGGLFLRYTLFADGVEMNSKTIDLRAVSSGEGITQVPPSVYPETDSVR